MKRAIVEHEGHRILVQPTKNSVRYSIYKFVNGEQFGIGDEYKEDTEVNRGKFIQEAIAAFERARAAPFN